MIYINKILSLLELVETANQSTFDLLFELKSRLSLYDFSDVLYNNIKINDKMRLKIDYFEECLEKHYSVLLSQLIDLPCFQSYFRQITAEIELAKQMPHFSDISVIYFVGCGSLPISAILWKQLTGKKVVAIDYQTDALENANKLINRLGVDIELIQTNGKQFSYDSNGLVILANMIDNLDQMFQQLYNNNVKNVIVRTTHGIRTIYYESHQLNPILEKYPYSVIDHSDPVSGKFISTSYLVEMVD